MNGSYFSQRLQSFQTLPIDYYILQRRHQLNGAVPVFVNRYFVVYDAHDLQKGTALLR